MNSKKALKVLLVGCGNMGTSHARAYSAMPEYKLVGLVSRGPESREKLSQELGGIPTYDNYEVALNTTQPDVVSINTYPETHAPYIRIALEADCHVFAEKPLALTVESAQSLVDLALQKNLKLVVGYILRVHPAWTKFIEVAKTLGKPLVMRMNLNQQSSGATWRTHQQLMQSMSPIVDCGVHYVDIMCLMTGSTPISVSTIGARLSDDLPKGMYNYGQLQVRFEDGSVGWYESGWGPMISKTAFFVKDVMGPKGAVSIIDKPPGKTDNIEEHTNTGGLLVHHSSLDADGEFNQKDELLDMSDEPSHDELCQLEQEYLLAAIHEEVDITNHLRDAINSLRVVLAADESFRTGATISLR